MVFFSRRFDYKFHQNQIVKLHCIKIKFQLIYVQRYVATKRSQKKSKSLQWDTSKEKIARKRYVRKNKLSRINFQCQESGLFIPETYPSLGAIPDDVISCNYYGEEILEIKSPQTSRAKLISQYLVQPESCLTQTIVIK